MDFKGKVIEKYIMDSTLKKKRIAMKITEWRIIKLGKNSSELGKTNKYIKRILPKDLASTPDVCQSKYVQKGL